MNQTKPKSVSKKLVKFDSIPEDVALVIAAEIKSFAAVEGTLEEKEEAKMERDSTLWSAALSCRANFSLYFPHLLQNVTLYSFHVISFAEWLTAGGDGSLVRSFAIYGGYGSRGGEAFVSTVEGYSSLPSHDNSIERYQDGLLRISNAVYSGLPNVKTMNIQFPTFIFKFPSRPDSFINSLKKLLIMRALEKDNNLSGRNVLWLLLFVPKLEETALAFDLGAYDCKILGDSADWFKGSSNVKKLSLAFRAIYDKTDRKTWWGIPQEAMHKWEGGNKKGTAIFNLIRCTKKLQSFELSSDQGKLTDQDKSLLFSSCLLGLERSFGTLHHLRLSNVAIGQQSLASTSFSNFTALRVLTIDGGTLYNFCKHGKFKLPPNLEVISLVFYRIHAQEDGMLALFIQSRSSSLPRLKEVVVPLNFMQADGEDIKPEDQEPWKEDRKKLEVVTSGRGLQLRKVKQGEEVGDAAKGEVFLSSVLWVSN